MAVPADPQFEVRDCMRTMSSDVMFPFVPNVSGPVCVLISGHISDNRCCKPCRQVEEALATERGVGMDCNGVTGIEGTKVSSKMSPGCCNAKATSLVWEFTSASMVCSTVVSAAG
mmetsp:Transcript_102306/g.289274  ORF Transcript_102306/g.289274 Transcript_102306/m.289274 type:complete len:115 (+) Transcript_102306:51-395(+)